ncbi:MAG: hypothetical protein MUP82_08480, partial [Candidatus Marinimicrobia bacterium]|nr:hypothetical protein [Candidatus Neomarinimicrobiota bacterium]
MKYYKKILSTVFTTLLIILPFPLTGQFFLPIEMPDSTSATQPLNAPLGKPYGGGAGYFPIITPEESNIVINTNDFNNLKSQLANASYGDIVYVNDNLEIEIPIEGTLIIPDGVTLASGRGRRGSLGALIYHNEDRLVSWYNSILGMDQVEITGLR